MKPTYARKTAGNVGVERGSMRSLQELTYQYVQQVLNSDNEDLRACLDHLNVAVSRDNWLEGDNKQRLLMDRVRHALVMEWKRRDTSHEN